MRQATQRAERAAARLITRDGPQAPWTGRAWPRSRTAIRLYRDGGSISPAVRYAWLALALTRLPVRDDAWARMDPEHRDAHRRLWTDLVRRAQPGYVARSGVACWRSPPGRAARAPWPTSRSTARSPTTPDYSMALLLRDALTRGCPPSMAVARP